MSFDQFLDVITSADLAGDYPTIRYGPPTGNLIIDLLAGLGTAFRFEDLESEVREFGGVRVQVATPETLVRMKQDTVRPRDHADPALLRERFNLRGKE